MEFYQVNNFLNTRTTASGIDMMLMSQLFKSIGSNPASRTLNDVMGYMVVLLKEGEFASDNPHLFYSGHVKVGKLKTAYALVALGQCFSMRHGEEEFSGKIINGVLLIAPPTVLPELIAKENEAFKNLSPEEMKVVQWLETGETGASSLSLCSAIYPQFIERHHKLENLRISEPQDQSDIARCMRFLEAVPEAVAKLDAAKSLSARWKDLIDGWSELESAHHTMVKDVLEDCNQPHRTPTKKM